MRHEGIYRNLTNKLYCVDCVEFMEKLPDESINMVMTSPPYWGLRDYGIPGQIGLEPTWQEYVERLRRVGEEIMRVLKKDGSFYLNLGDTFQNKMKLGIPWRVRFALNEVGWISRADIVWHKPNAMPSSVKDRLNCTYEMLFHFVKSKKYYFDLDVIREPHKTAPLGKHQKTMKLQQFLTPLVKKNYRGKFRGMGLNVERFGSPRARSKRIYRGAPTNPPHRSAYGEYWAGINPHMTIHPKGKNPGDVFSFKHHGSTFYTSENRRAREILIGTNSLGRNPGDTVDIPSETKSKVILLGQGSKEIAKMRKEGKIHWLIHPSKDPRWFDVNGKNPGDFWKINTKPFKGAHFAVYPEALCIKPILSSSRPGDIVLDPFIGSGTTAVMAKKLGRRFLGCDINPNYVKIAEKRLKAMSSNRKT